MKKIISLIITVIMVLSMMPVAALVSSAAAPDHYVYPAVIATNSEGVNSVTVIGVVRNPDIITSADAIRLTVDFQQDNVSINTKDYEFKNVYTTVTDVASTDSLTAAAQSSIFINEEDAVLYALKINNVPEGDYTVVSTAEIISDVASYADATATSEAYLNGKDVLTNNTVGVTGTSYTDWTRSFYSSALYAGYTAGGNLSVQMRTSDNESGIVTLESAGLVTSIDVCFEGHTAESRTVQVFGSNMPYSSTADLYKEATQGTLIGEININDGTEQTLTITDEYFYIGIRSKSGALYLESIAIEWDTTVAVPEVDPNEVLTAELEAIPTETTIGEASSYTLPVPSNQKVSFAWAIEYGEDYAQIVDGVLVPNDISDDVSVSLSLTAEYKGASQSTEMIVNITAIKDLTDEEKLDILYGLTDTQMTEEQYVLTGVVTQIVYNYSTNNGISFNMVVGGDIDRPVYVFKLKNGEGVKDIKVNDTVSVLGQFQKYVKNDTTTFELVNGELKELEPYQLSAAEKVAAEVANLDNFLAEKYTTDQEITLRAAGKDYEDVSITWAVTSGTAATINNGKLYLTVTTTSVTVTVTATVSCGSESDNKAFSITLQKNTTTSKTDTLDRAATGRTGTTYGEWSGVEGASGAVYAGQSAGGNESIQLRSNNNTSGIISTTSAGNVVSVTVTWNSNTVNGRTLNIYGSDTAYSSPADLYNAATQGTLLGTIVCGTSTTLTITDEYAYIGLRSAGSAMYIDEIEIVWG